MFVEEIRIRENVEFSKIPAVLFLKGEEKRMGDFVKEKGVISKCFLEVNGEPIFWASFESLLNNGIKEFIIVTLGRGKEIWEYIDEKLKNLKDTNQIGNGIKIYIFESNIKETAKQLLQLKGIVGNRQFLIIFGDERYGKKEESRAEFKKFIEFASFSMTQNDALIVQALVPKSIILSNINPNALTFNIEEDNKLVPAKSDLYLVSLSLNSPKLFEIIEKASVNELYSQEFLQAIRRYKIYGKVLNITYFSNINFPIDYFKLVSHIKELNEKNRKDLEKIK
jgi:NDP-sugar pyrophosphorylase family protein